MPESAPPLQVSDLHRWKLLDEFRQRLARAVAGRPLPSSLADPRRQLLQAEYLSLFLFGLLNPVVRTMRALCAASRFERVQGEVCARAVSLGSFSQTQHVLDPLLLQQVFGELSEAVQGRGGEERLRGKRWLIADSTLWEALPRMHWALWRTQGVRQQAVRLHLSFHLLEDKPVRAVISEGRRCERAAWRTQWQAGDCYVGDRYFGEDYGMLDALSAQGCGYVIRLREQATVHGEEELTVSEADRAAGVVRQAWVRLGCQARYRSGRLRVVWVQTPKEVLLLATNQEPEAMSAELVALVYRYRWQVEMFFRWIKCILGNRHWLAESERGVTIQMYLALIAALLLQLYGGRRPTKRRMEAIQMYLLGWVSLEELEAVVVAEERVAKKS